MKAALALVAVPAILAAAVSPAQAPPSQTASPQAVSEGEPLDGTTPTDKLQFRDDAHERMTVPVSLSGQGPFRFIVDTGSERTAISRELAARLDLEPGEAARIHSVTGVDAVQTATVPLLQFSKRRITGVEAPLLDAHNIGADGILGVDSLRSQRVLFDFKAKTMAIYPGAKRAMPDEPGTIVVRGRLKNGRLVLTNARADRRKVTVVIDTGADVTIGNDELRRQLARDGMLRNAGRVQLRSVTGDVLVGDYTFIETLKIGGVELRNLAVVFADAHTFRKLRLEERPALLLGMNAMRSFEQVTIDFATRRLRLRIPDSSSLDQAAFAQR